VEQHARFTSLAVKRVETKEKQPRACFWQPALRLLKATVRAQSTRLGTSTKGELGRVFAAMPIFSPACALL
jgi:hypothetical protein